MILQGNTQINDLSHTSKVWPKSNIISFQQFIHSLFDERHVPRFIDAERQITTNVVSPTESRHPGLCPALTPTHTHSPPGTAHHCHDQRQWKNVKEPCSLGSPHPLCAVWMNEMNESCPAFNKWLNGDATQAHLHKVRPVPHYFPFGLSLCWHALQGRDVMTLLWNEFSGWDAAAEP